jgi:2-keto-myo-inositol isomerase
MRTCLNLVSLKRGLDPLEGVAVAADAGFEGVGLWADAFEAQPDPVAHAKKVAKLCADRGVKVEEMCFVGGWMWAEGEARDKALDAIRRRTEFAAEAGCPLIIACAAGGTGCNQKAADDFATVCEIGAPLGVSFALEYIGVFPQVKDIPSGLEIVRLAKHPNAKLVIDIFHTFRGGSTVADFDLPKGCEVGLVHMNDVPAGDIMQMNDSFRVMPGDGVLPLKEALGKLEAHGFEGALSVEVFSEAWWAKPYAEIAAAALAGLRKVMP